MEDIAFQSAIELRENLLNKKISAVEVMKATLDRLDKFEPTINAFSSIDYDKALEDAQHADEKLLAGDKIGVLHGIPISIKDLIDVKGMNTTFGSKTKQDNYAHKDAPAVERIRESGACIIGKTTTTEFGCKAGGGDSPLTGVTRNIWNPKMTTGGSSAGSATSVAAGITPLSLGTDGGGSLRIPASFCGIFGIKAQFGRVPVFPASATPTVGHVGPLARNVRDAALLLEVISGYDGRDPATVSERIPRFLDACNEDIKGMKIAWSPTLGYAKPTAEILEITKKAVTIFESMGCEVELVEEPIGKDPIDLWTAEFYAGVGTKLKDPLANNRDLLDPAVADILDNALDQRIDEYYSKVFMRYGFHEKVRNLFEDYDLLITPTLPVPPFEAGTNVPKELSERNIVSWVYYTYPFNLTGNPAASINCGFTKDFLPVGLQIVSAKNREVDIFKAANSYENATYWKSKRPN